MKRLHKEEISSGKIYQSISLRDFKGPRTNKVIQQTTMLRNQSIENSHWNQRTINHQIKEIARKSNDGIKIDPTQSRECKRKCT